MVLHLSAAKLMCLYQQHNWLFSLAQLYIRKNASNSFMELCCSLTDLFVCLSIIRTFQLDLQDCKTTLLNHRHVIKIVLTNFIPIKQIHHIYFIFIQHKERLLCCLWEVSGWITINVSVIDFQPPALCIYFQILIFAAVIQ